jgi:FkbH-like protein
MSGTRNQFHLALLEVLGAEPGIAVIHSSLFRLAPPAPFEPWDALYGIDQLVRAGWTMAFPAFTFSFCRGQPYDYRTSASETGVLADWVLAYLPDARRTPHAIYSFAVVGPATERIVACRSTTTFGDDSPFGLFERENATLAMLACGWKYCTQFHRCEERARVPYRYFKEFTGTADFGAGAAPAQAQMYVRDLAADPVNDFMPAVEQLRKEGHIRTMPLWRGEIETVKVVELTRVLMAMLKTDGLAFVANASAVAHRLKAQRAAASQPVFRLAVLGSSNVHLLRSALESELAELMPERKVETFEVPYGQLRQALLDPGSELRQFQPQFSIFCDRLEDILGQPFLDVSDPARIEDAIAEQADLIAAFHQANGGWIVLHQFAALRSGADDQGGHVTAGVVARANGLMEERLARLPQVAWLDVAAEAAAEPAPALDPRLWYLGRFPFSDAMTRRLARRLAGLALATVGKTARLVVVDLDNTLWGGVLGEDGMAGVHIGGDYPGNAFAAFQQALKTLIARGIALAVCSKNDEDLATKAIEELPAMGIRLDDLVAHRINWRPKSVNLAEIAEELSLGLDSILFVDDNPVEREAMRRALPGVKVLDLPTDPAEYVDALLRSPWLAVAAVTSEDRRRLQGYKARREIEQERVRATSLEDFYAGLKMKLTLQPLADGNIARAAQLCQKTNQFNTTTRGYDQRDLRRIVEEGGDVVVLGLEDRHSPLENIGLLILTPDPEAAGQGLVDDYLMSCRVLGRGIETSVLHWAVRRAALRGWGKLRGLIIETERNTPVRAVFRDAGFARGASPEEWIARTDNPNETAPWLTIVDLNATLVAA